MLFFKNKPTPVLRSTLNQLGTKTILKRALISSSNFTCPKSSTLHACEKTIFYITISENKSTRQTKLLTFLLETGTFQVYCLLQVNTVRYI